MEKEVRECQGCQELALIEFGEKLCFDCKEKQKSKNKDHLNI